MGYRINDDSSSWLLDGPLKFTRFGLKTRRWMDPQLTASRKRTHQKGLPPTWADNVPTLSLARLKLQRKNRFQQKTVTSIIYVCLTKKTKTRGHLAVWSGTMRTPISLLSFHFVSSPNGLNWAIALMNALPKLTLWRSIPWRQKCRFHRKLLRAFWTAWNPKKNGVSGFRCCTKTAFVNITGRHKLRVFCEDEWWVIINSWALGETTNQLQEVVDLYFWKSCWYLV